MYLSSNSVFLGEHSPIFSYTESSFCRIFFLAHIATDHLGVLGKISVTGTFLGAPGLVCQSEISKWIGSNFRHFQAAGEV